MLSHSEERRAHDEEMRFEERRSRSEHREETGHRVRNEPQSGHVDRASAGSPTHSPHRRKTGDPETARRFDASAVHETARRPATSADPETARRLAASAKLQVNDLVKAQCPWAGELCDATICALRENGLLEVRWHNPGIDGNGRSFQPYGDVWADAVQLVYRKPIEQARPTSNSPTPESGASLLPYGLTVGDPCFALGVLVEKEWYQAKIIGVRQKPPQFRIEYVATFGGDTTSLLLPEPRKAYVPAQFLRRGRPDAASAAAAYNDALHPSSASESHLAPVQGQASTSEHSRTDSPSAKRERAQPSGEAEAVSSSQADDAPIDPDLMCKICSRPDQEHLMLLCEDCRSGFHTFCIPPPLSAIPEHDWYCPQCSAKRSAEGA